MYEEGREKSECECKMCQRSVFRARRSPSLCPQAKDVVRARVSCAHPSLP